MIKNKAIYKKYQNIKLKPAAAAHTISKDAAGQIKKKIKQHIIIGKPSLMQKVQ